jgi:hypothetical protein
MPDSPGKMERFLEKHGSYFLENILVMRDWVLHPGVLSLSFEEILGDHGAARQRQAVQQIVDLLGISLPPERISEVLKQCLGKETLTFSGKRSSRKELWSEFVEGFFLEKEARELEEFWQKHLGQREHLKCAG